MMKQALLIIDHGSRLDTANNLIYDVVTMVQSLKPDIIIEAAHMELAEPTIEQGIQACIDKGATHIIAHPYMLGPGRHATKDIPNLVEEACKKHPKITYTVTNPLGVDENIGKLILKRAGL